MPTAGSAPPPAQANIMSDADRGDTQCYVYEFVVDASRITPDEMHMVLRTLCKTYVFQMERGEQSTELHPEGYLHYQGRLSLIKKAQITVAARLLKAAANDVVFSLKHTLKDQVKGEAFYQMKAQTRVQGPWTEKDFRELPPMTKRLKKVMDNGLFPWQERLKDLVSEYDDRSIHLVHDPAGNHGKSAFCEYMEYKGLAYEVPPFRLMEDIMACAMGIPNQTCYMIDMPKGMKKEKLGDFYSGIESLKNGVVYDKRYHFKKRRMECPQVVVFTNTLPNLDYLSKDRWVIHTIQSLEDAFHEAQVCQHPRPCEESTQGGLSEEEAV